jgi:hypothetical protein
VAAIWALGLALVGSGSWLARWWSRKESTGGSGVPRNWSGRVDVELKTSSADETVVSSLGASLKLRRT